MDHQIGHGEDSFWSALNEGSLTQTGGMHHLICMSMYVQRTEMTAEGFICIWLDEVTIQMEPCADSCRGVALRLAGEVHPNVCPTPAHLLCGARLLMASTRMYGGRSAVA